MKRKGIYASILFSTMLVLGACGGGETDEGAENDDTGMEEGTNEGTEEGATEGGGETTSSLEITATNWKFNQDSYKVTSGEAVTINFESKEGVHGLGIKGKNDFNIKKSGSKELTLEPGEYQVYCTIPCGEGHADMVSTLIVE
ncbi:cytochrome C oxidase subunit II [Alkalihalobacillus sp. AL-G]|uniref:cytochrome C oxidase subunit II n=1 Tax=Alkalihalobacillus sp. AL-G TaxID=2926399 RepID=UPI002729C581|nr:cytochrome C oxidase subunit II [Alkalihalobacillus sp. AL-G]WLD94812.1 cytochrome C oxidase subunit II [Alkalihalobacillus sp. AL-G]